MNTEAEIAVELDDLVNQVPTLLDLARKPTDIVSFGDLYQPWYSRALKLVELLGRDRLEEFVTYYRADPKRKAYELGTYVLQDYVNGLSAALDVYGKPKWDIHTAAFIRVTNQKQILDSLRGRLEGVLADVRGHLLSELEDEELQTATKLLRVSPRAAGALAGVVLEAHLQRVAVNHKISIKKRSPTINDLNEPLKAAGIYDLPTWRKIQHLTDVRNLCDHKKEREPSKSEVEELIAGVRTLVKTVH